MYQVCTCPQSSLTAGDPNCPIHGHPPASVTTSWCESCASLLSRIAELEERLRVGNILYGGEVIRRREAEAKLAAALQRTEKEAKRLCRVIEWACTLPFEFGEGGAMTRRKFNELREKMPAEARKEVHERASKIITDPKTILQIVLDTVEGSYSAAGVYFLTESTVRLMRNALMEGKA